MNNLINSLGLGSVNADPNFLPKATYEGEVMKSELVFVPSKNTVSHVITYRVTEGEKKGAQQAEWFALGKDPVDANGNPVTSLSDAASITPTQTDQNKQWYKKRFVDLGVAKADSEVLPSPEELVGLNVRFGIKHVDGYQNISFVEAAKPSTTQATAQPGQVAGGVTGIL